MITEVTEGIKISVETQFQPDHSDASSNMYLFSYRIIIENCGSQTVKLIRRRWLIYDANGVIREVEGKGVVGQQPILKHGEIHEYSSACDLTTDIGKMHGTYLMEWEESKERFYVNIPEFKMVVPHRLN
ncbi:MAG TPA: Co2+/Mg2+ efflux protein ApaG [Flavobacteriales bacterium]|jgi:ApaG protein|nr:Co2+/Mg2+ efflux protein ApaG [Flavobacteriales bacterium]